MRISIDKKNLWCSNQARFYPKWQLQAFLESANTTRFRVSIDLEILAVF